jgi:hypothetical protein
VRETSLFGLEMINYTSLIVFVHGMMTTILYGAIAMHNLFFLTPSRLRRASEEDVRRLNKF